MRILKILKRIGIDILKKIYSLCLNILLFVAFLILIGLMVSKFSTTTEETIETGTFVKLSFPNGIQEKALEKVPFGINKKSEKLNFYNILKSLEVMKDNKKVRGIIINLDSFNLTANHRTELTKKLTEVKESGKKIYAYGTFINNKSYEMALLADEIIMPPSASTSFNLNGYYRNMGYYKNLGEKLGISFSIINTGDYKTYGEQYIKNGMSEELKEELKRIYDDNYMNFVKKVSFSKKMIFKDLNDDIEKGKYAVSSSLEAKKYNLIDGLFYYNEFLRMKNINEKKIISLTEFYRIEVKKKNISSKNKIALIYAEGGIKMDDGNYSQIKDGVVPSVICSEIKKASKDKNVRGIVIRVNSPGGSALASQIILKSIEEAQKKKPVYISIGNVGASGGYYISSKGDKIFATENTITGSIGVVLLIPNFENLSKKVGVEFDFIERGKYSGIYDVTKKMSTDEIEVLQKRAEAIYKEFKENVSEGRNINMDEVQKIAQGKVWLGKEALEIGLIDEIGGLEETISGLAKDLKLKKYQVMEYKKEFEYKDMIKKMIYDVKSEKIISGLFSSYEDVMEYSKKAVLLFPIRIER
ncbi:MAG: signal peptide peptidase SppA [Fusobacteriia bacterium 4572_132]|nr:MAG: signal peptide peptidase SppA [Fusobacteriia bacterium 4572_132]